MREGRERAGEKGKVPLQRKIGLQKDFEWMKNHGINTVRLPIGFWAVIHHPPYPYAKAALERALQMAQLHHIDVLVDLHGAPGSQNGWDHSGHAGALNWTKPANIELTLQVIEELAALCTRYPCVAGQVPAG